MISGIRWVSELVEIAGGEDMFSKRSLSQAAAGRIVADGGEVVRAKPDVILGSWCGKKFRPETSRRAAGLGRDSGGEETVSCTRSSRPRSCSPGPAALTDGVRRIHQILRACVSRR